MIRKSIFTLSIIIIYIFSPCTNIGQNHYTILVSFDGFRWDYANRGITPNLDKIKETGVSALSLRPVFPSKTFPNHLSIITGMHPQNHGIIQNDFIDPITNKKYALWDSNAVKESRWYLGEPFWETAERQGIKTASYFWPGSEVSLSYKHPSYFEKYNFDRPFSDRINGVIKWLQLPYNIRPHFLTLYFEDTDSKGHTYGTNSVEIRNSITLSDSLVGVLFKKLEEIGLIDSTNVIILSDHGMTNISDERSINIEKIIGSDNQIQGTGPIMMIQPSRDKINEIYNLLKKNENHYTVYNKLNIPEYFHFSESRLISDIIVLADMGWSLNTNKSEKNKPDYLKGGNHGYDNNQLDMHGIFFAVGPAFKNGYRTGTLWNIDIYPLLCKLFKIYPRQNIDGKIERIGFILK